MSNKMVSNTSKLSNVTSKKDTFVLHANNDTHTQSLLRIVQRWRTVYQKNSGVAVAEANADAHSRCLCQHIPQTCFMCRTLPASPRSCSSMWFLLKDHFQVLPYLLILFVAWLMHMTTLFRHSTDQIETYNDHDAGAHEQLRYVSVAQAYRL